VSAEPVTTTVWTCSRCGAVKECDGLGQPGDWIRVYFANPPKGAEQRPLGYLCDPCGGYLVTFVSGGDVAAEEARNAEYQAMLSAAGA
jgi:hypothetical protein